MPATGRICLFTALTAASAVASQVQSGAPGDQLQQLTRAEAIWLASKPEAYEFRFEYACHGLIEVPPGGLQPLLFRIKGGETTFPSDPVAHVPNHLQRYATVEKQFALIRKALDNRPYRLEAQYDPHLGCPTRLCVDPVMEIADDEYGFLITDFKVLSK
jgi:hypothetical protein